MIAHDNDAPNDRQLRERAARIVCRWNGDTATRAALLAEGAHAEAYTVPGWIAVYEIDRVYGGPEEGGWWRDVGHLVACVPADRWAVCRRVGTDEAGVPVRMHARELHRCDGDETALPPDASGIPLADGMAAEAMVAACLARYGVDAFTRSASSVAYDGGALALEWRDEAPEAHYGYGGGYE